MSENWEKLDDVFMILILRCTSRTGKTYHGDHLLIDWPVGAEPDDDKSMSIVLIIMTVSQRDSPRNTLCPIEPDQVNACRDSFLNFLPIF